MPGVAVGFAVNGLPEIVTTTFAVSLQVVVKSVYVTINLVVVPRFTVIGFAIVLLPDKLPAGDQLNEGLPLPE